MIGATDLGARFAARFGARPRLFRAPGRINIIGEHVDYCDGLVLPAAIDRWCTVAAAPNGTQRLRVVALDLDAAADLDLGALAPRGDWSDYVAGVADVLQRAGIAVPGVDLMITSSVPVGGGVSSSAAIEVAALLALLALAGAGDGSGQPLARWAQAAENNFVGVPCGIMDQFASVHGVAGHALRLDCRTLAATPVALPADAAFVLVDSMQRHSLVSGEYASRRADCETAARLLGVASLRDANAAQLAAVILPDGPARRARHVIAEIARVDAAVAALAAGDMAGLGRLLDASHASLAADMAVSTAALDTLAAAARDVPGVFGARMMGGGFGGSVLVLVGAADADAASAATIARYAAATGTVATALVVRAVSGAAEVGQ
ncbi:MAG: galactokinase [Polymorphobacter sp.]